MELEPEKYLMRGSITKLAHCALFLEPNFQLLAVKNEQNIINFNMESALFSKNRLNPDMVHGGLLKFKGPS